MAVWHPGLEIGTSFTLLKLLSFNIHTRQVDFLFCLLNNCTTTVLFHFQCLAMDENWLKCQKIRSILSGWDHAWNSYFSCFLVLFTVQNSLQQTIFSVIY